MRTPPAVALAVVGLVAAAVVLVRLVAEDRAPERHRFFVATSGSAVRARDGPSDRSDARAATHASGEPVWVACWVAGPDDDRHWYRLEDGGYLPEDVLFPEAGDAPGPPRCLDGPLPRTAAEPVLPARQAGIGAPQEIRRGAGRAPGIGSPA